MNSFAMVVISLCSFGALVISSIRLYMDWKRSKSSAWETAVRLMVSDPHSRIRSDDFAELYTALQYLEKHPDCLSEKRTMRDALLDDHIIGHSR